MPEGVRVEAMEETADTIYLVLPVVSADAREVGELSDRELEAVAGGDAVTWSGNTCQYNSCMCAPTDAC